jgi:hypothetical protein
MQAENTRNGNVRTVDCPAHVAFFGTTCGFGLNSVILDGAVERSGVRMVDPE